MEKARLPSPAEHPSYQNHRHQLWTQILLPLLAALLIVIAVIVVIALATFRDDGDVERWAAISTIWLVIPLIAAGLLLLIVFSAMIYGMARLLALIPPYTGYAQRAVWRIEGYIKRGADEAIKPILALDGAIATFRRLLGIK